jgi:hypothetical protein
MGCSTPSSKTLKSALCRSVTGVPKTFVTWAGTKTRAESTRMSALGKIVWPVGTAGRKRGRMETAVSLPDTWKAQQWEHAKIATARHAAKSSVRAIGRLYLKGRQAAQFPIHGIRTSPATALAGCSSDNLIVALIICSIREVVLSSNIASRKRCGSRLCRYPA